MQNLLRASGKIRRRFVAMPHWFRDLYGLVSYVNFLELIPTLVCLGLAPRHFFRRLPLTLDGKRPLFQTPVKFFANFAALFLTLFFLRHGDLRAISDPNQAPWMLLLLIPLTPVLMFGLGLGTYLLYHLPRLAPNGSSFPSPNRGTFRLLLSPLTYLRIDPVRFLWGLFYITLYFVTAWQLVQFILGYSFLAVAYVSSALGDGHVAVRGILILLGVGISVLTVHGLILHPYQELLRASLRRPNPAVFESDVHAIRECVRDFLEQPNQASEFVEQANIFAIELAYELERHRLVLMQQDVDFEIEAPSKQLRQDLLSDALQIEQIQVHVWPLADSVQTAILQSLEPQVCDQPSTIKQAA